MSTLVVCEELQAGMEPYPGYRLRQILGRGGFAEVWEAEKPEGACVALKFLRVGKDHLASAREIRAIQRVRQLSHPNLTQIENVWSHLGYLVIAMELAEGSLLDLLEASLTEFGEPIAPEQVCLLLAQAAQALDFLNTRQHFLEGKRVAIQHCDVKPSNLLLFGDTVKLADFGLSSSTSSPMQAHRRAGTLAYTAPEVFQGRLSDHTDQYALAVSYCELRGGRLPFTDTPDVFDTNYTRPAPDLTMVSEPERPVLARALNPIPSDRWPSSGEMIVNLQQALATSEEAVRFQPEVPSALPAATRPPQRNRRASFRYPCSVETTCRLLGKKGGEVWKTSLVDISERGVGLTSDRTVEFGTMLEIQPGETTRLGPLYAYIVRVIPRGEGNWVLGGILTRPLTKDKIQAIVSAPPSR